MKKRFVKKYAVLYRAKKGDYDCKCYERKHERHRWHYIRKFRHFIRTAKRQDWKWYYYFQCVAPILSGLSHGEAIKAADLCIAEIMKDYRKC